MNELAEILKNTQVSALINAKPIRKKNLVCLIDTDTIRTALETFIAQDIESIPIKKSNIIVDVESHEIDIDKGPDGFLEPQFMASEILDLQLRNIDKNEKVTQKIEYVNSHMSLLHLLLNIWGGTCKPKSHNIDCKHLLTSTYCCKYDVITPLDFLRHLLFAGINAINCLHTSLATEIENGIDIDENSMVSWDEDINVAVNRLIQSEPSFILAIVDKDTGSLEANVTFNDILPKDFSLIDESISMIRRQGIAVHSYLHSIQIALSPKSAIDPIVLHPHYTVFDLIEKLTRLRIHHLWRITPDAKKKPIGAVGVNDILRYLCFMFRPFLLDYAPPEGELIIQN